MIRTPIPRLAWRLAACLTPLLAAPPAHAGLLIEQLEVSATASVRVDGGVAPGQRRDDLFDDQPNALPFVLSANAAVDTQVALAQQAKNGFFQNRSAASFGYRSLDAVTGSARTGYLLTVGTNTPDTPLRLDFNVLGAQTRGGAYYGSGEINVSTHLRISGAIGATPILMPTVWGFEDVVSLSSSSGGDRFTTAATEWDTQGIGLPAAIQASGWEQFVSMGSAARGGFLGTLDFGLLQPGEHFTLLYEGGTSIHLRDVAYGGSALATLVDPFTLGGPAPFTLRGLELPTSPVPEPATWALLLAGLLVMWRLARREPTARRFTAPPWLIVPLVLPSAAWAGAYAEVYQAPSGVGGKFHQVEDAAASGVASVETGQTFANPWGTATWQGVASASTRRGSIAAAVITGSTGDTGGLTVVSHGRVGDEMVFTGPNARYIDFSLSVLGGFHSARPSAFSANAALTVLREIQSTVTFSWANTGFQLLSSVYERGDVDLISATPARLGARLNLHHWVVPGQPFTLQAEMYVQARAADNDEARALFDHTAQIGFDLPEGWSFSSASGSFLADMPTSPVPQPGTALLALGGLLGLAPTVGRARRGSRAASIQPPFSRSSHPAASSAISGRA